ncbi:MAG TPA: aminotransferase class I/II-fold pyridoxal phosphate-dependent enzyme, partial [Terriglobales bacterium]|nr:aminotransferase class I/II-fold pyridoxal phosphate-dependent enzyme [Terriglobales bacterium]
MAIPDFVAAELERRRGAGLLRQMREIAGAQGSAVEVAGRSVLLLCSNNYLGLADHPALAEAAAQAARDYGVGAGASRLISGSMRLHRQLEEELAELKHCPRALLFNSGYQANIGTIAALVGRNDEVFSDELNHASLIDGCRLSRARIQVYPHCDVGVLADQLAASRARRKLIVTDSVFSMDGDLAPLHELCGLAERYGAMLMVDEAHATGVLGAGGAGAVAMLGLSDRVTVQMGTLGKAIGAFGAFVAAAEPVIELLVNAARSFVFTTALPPPVVASARTGLAIARGADDRRMQLRHNAARLIDGLLGLGFDL